MDKKINLSQLANMLSEQSGMKVTESDLFVSSFFKVIVETLEKGESVKIKGLGNFKLIDVAQRESVNVNTGERFVIAAHKKISLVPDSTLKQKINKPFAQFASILLSDEQVEAVRAKDSDKRGKQVTVSDKEIEVTDQQNREKLELQTEESVDHLEVPKKSHKKITRHLKPTKKRNTVKILIYLLSGIMAVLFFVYYSGSLFLFDKLKLKTKESSGAIVEFLESIVESETDLEWQEDIVEWQEDIVEWQDDIVEWQEDSVNNDTEKSEEGNNLTVSQSVFRLTSGDEKKELSEFTLADTVNYSMGEIIAEHAMAAGETITLLAQRYYGTKKLWPYIAAYNKMSKFLKIQVGDIILVPELNNR